MMNVIALWILFSTLGAANVMFPDQSLLKTSDGEQQHLEGAKAAATEHLEGAKAAATESLRSFLETGRQTREGIRETVSAASHIPKRTADAVQHFGEDVAQVVKDGSQSGLEKIGLARPDEKSYNEIIKEEALGVYGRTKDAAGDTMEATGDKVRQAGSAAKEKFSNTVEYVQETGSEKVASVGDSASGIAQSLQDNFNAAEGKASEIGRSAHEHATDVLKGTSEKTDHTNVDSSVSSYKDKVKHASEQAAEIVRSRATEAASVLPNVGQGLAYSTKDTHEKETTAGWKKQPTPGVFGKIIEYLIGVKHAAGNYYECAKGKLSGSAVQCGKWKDQIVNKASNTMSEADEIAGRAKDRAVDIARNSAGKIIDGIHGTKHDLDDKRAEESRKFYDTRDNLTETTADAANSLKSRTLSRFQKLKWIASAYLLSSCRTAHFFVFSSVYGSSLWVTFVSGYMLSRSIPRQQFAIVQSRIFPAYFKLAGGGQAICLLLFLILHPWSKADSGEKLQQLDLSAILLLSLANVFLLEPRATKAMFQKLKIEKEEGRGQDGLSSSEDDEAKAGKAKIDKTFMTYHGYSSMANLLSLIGMTWHLWHLSGRLVV